MLVVFFFFFFCVCVYFFFFFFSSRRRHTRSLCDWSSDVCSSDLESAPSEKNDSTSTVSHHSAPRDRRRQPYVRAFRKRPQSPSRLPGEKLVLSRAAVCPNELSGVSSAGSRS